MSACKAVTFGGVADASLSSPRVIIMKLQVYWGHASAHQLKRVSVDSDGGAMRSANYVDVA